MITRTLCLHTMVQSADPRHGDIHRRKPMMPYQPQTLCCYRPGQKALHAPIPGSINVRIAINKPPRARKPVAAIPPR